MAQVTGGILLKRTDTVAGGENLLASGKRSFKPSLVSEEEFAKIKERSVKIYAYANRVLSMANMFHEHTEAGFALFDRDGYLLKLYGSDNYIAWCQNHRISVRSRWTAASVGRTAVSMGLESLKTVETSGSDHENVSLQDVSITFCPLILEQKINQTSYELLGGIAIFSPADSPQPESGLICSAIANDITLHMFMANDLHDMYFQEIKGFINIDINVTTGSPHVLYHNEQIFRILGIPHENLYFKKAELFFDPLPANQEFWNIVQNRRAVDDQLIPLTIHGKTDTYLVSTVPYRQTHLNFCGVRFFISSPKSLSSHVAQHIGNNAMFSFNNIWGESPAMQRCIAQAKSIAHSASNVMITGESGVGKDIFAQAIHNASRRRDKPFIVLNCAAYPRDLLSSELFGYDGGAYTGAKKNGNLGKFELADTGTIFLDEIGDLPLELQVMLLRVIEQKSFMRIGSSVVRSVDVKIISATNADLQSMVEKKTFRPDLYFRLCTLNLYLPPLRERGQDIILLAERFIDGITSRLQLRQRKILSEEAKAMMLQLPWHGNVRELQNVMERVVQLIPEQIVTPQNLELCLDFPVSAQSAPPLAASGQPARDGFSRSHVAEITREMILQVLEENHYNRSLAAKALGISRRTFYRKLEEFQIQI